MIDEPMTVDADGELEQQVRRDLIIIPCQS